ncbi:MAG: hypothetical protein K0Q92_199 [Steroidobacteraceae bacterium]|jgi:hypothetical protein|nr:hypothetical protein [Steroidobacteraceae bacterium]
MSSLADLYAELKADVVAVADPLFEHSQKRLQAKDDFLPHAAVLSAEGKVVLMGAMTGSRDGQANAAHILPMLLNGVRQVSREKVLTAIGIAENVSLTRGEMPMHAIKVLLEHERGLTVALFLPFHKADSGEYFFGEAFVTPAPPALNLWPPVP